MTSRVAVIKVITVADQRNLGRLYISTSTGTLHIIYIPFVWNLRRATAARHQRRRATTRGVWTGLQACCGEEQQSMQFKSWNDPVHAILRAPCRISCRVGQIHFLAGWHTRRPETGFSFVRFSFVSFHLFRFIACFTSFVVVFLLLQQKMIG